MPVWIVGGQTATGVAVLVSLTTGASVNISSVVPVATQLATTGLPVWLAPTQSMSVSFPAVSGVIASSVPATSIALGLPVWLVGGQTATGVPVLVSISSQPAVITQVATSGGIAWLAPTQTMSVTVVNVVSVTGTSLNVVVSGIVSVTGTSLNVVVSGIVSVTGTSLNVVVSGPVSVSAIVSIAISTNFLTTAGPSVAAPGLMVWIAGGQSSTAVPVVVTGTVTAGAGTTVVSISGVAATVGPPSVAMSGIPMWIVGGQSSTAFPVVITGTVTAGAGTTVISISAIAATTAGPSISMTGIPVWIAGGQSSTAVPVVITGTVQGTMTATVTVSGAVAAVTTQSSVSGCPVWLAPTQTVQISAIVPAVTQANTTGFPVWLAPTQTITALVSGTVQVSGTILGKGGMVIMTVTQSSIIITSTTQFMIMTVPFDSYTSTVLVSGYTIRGGGALQFTAITMIYTAASVTASSLAVAIYATTSGVSLTVGAVQLWSTVFPTLTGAAILTVLSMPYTMVLPAGGVMGIAVWRSSSATTTISVAFTLVAQYQS